MNLNVRQLIEGLSGLKPHAVFSSDFSQVYEFSETIVIDAPAHSDIRLPGQLRYTGRGTAIVYKGNNSRLYVEDLQCANNAAIGIEVTNTFMSDIAVGELKGALTGMRIYGNGGGVAYCDFSARRMINGTNVLITADDAGGKIGYVNENTFHIRWMDGKTGFYFKKGKNQSAKFDNNTIYNPGFENISQCGLRLEAVTRSTVVSPRFERSYEDKRFTEGCIVENDECSRNIYISSYGISDKNKLKMKGVYSQYMGDLSADGDGEKIAYSVVNGANGNCVRFNVDQCGKLDSNTVFFAPTGTAMFSNYAMCLKNSEGEVRRVAAFDMIGYQKIVNGVAEIDKNTALIEVSATTIDSVLKMPQEKEVAGMEVSVNVPYKLRRITIKKSTGTVSIEDIGSATGLYKLFYKEDNWFCTKIGEPVRLSGY